MLRVGEGSLKGRIRKSSSSIGKKRAYVEDRDIHLEKSWKTNSRPKAKKFRLSAEMGSLNAIMGSARTDGYPDELPSTKPGR